jgi:hypothetical protein
VAAEITTNIAEEMTDALLHYLQETLLPKYGLDATDTFPAMEAVVRTWNEGDEDAEFEASYATAQAAMEGQQSLEELPPLNEKWRLN